MAVESFRTGCYLLNALYPCNLVINCKTLYWNILEFNVVCFCCIPRMGVRKMAVTWLVLIN
jgi:hypothetical protein